MSAAVEAGNRDRPSGRAPIARRPRERGGVRRGRPSLAPIRTWPAASPGRQCPRRSNSIPTLAVGNVPRARMARSGFQILGFLACVSFRGRGQRRSRSSCRSGVQWKLDAQPFSASTFSARFVHSSAISSRIAFWCGSALRAMRLHSSANFRYVSDSPIMRSFASQSMFANSFTPTQYQGTNRNKPRGGRVPRLQWVAGAGRCRKTSIVSTRSNVCF